MPIDILPGAALDMKLLRQSNPTALGVVLVVLEEADSDPKLIDKLTTYGEVKVGDDRLNVKPWVQARRTDNLWRFRVLDTPATDYRVVYGFDWRARRIGVLAIRPKKEFDYGIIGELADRIFGDWHEATGGRST